MFFAQGAVTTRPLQHPGEYTQIWVNKVASRFPISEVRSAYFTTGYSGLVRMGDRDSVWGLDNGLQSLIPALLTSSVLGYHFCLPDMVGGNAYWGQYPDTELIVRWAQVSIMMPSVQWSIPPWDISDTARTLCLAAEHDRQKVLLPRLLKLAVEASTSLAPICRPLWWLDPFDKETYAIDDQFAVGNDVIVAPVVEKGSRWRRLYLPIGEWVEGTVMCTTSSKSAIDIVTHRTLFLDHVGSPLMPHLKSSQFSSNWTKAHGIGSKEGIKRNCS